MASLSGHSSQPLPNKPNSNASSDSHSSKDGAQPHHNLNTQSRSCDSGPSIILDNSNRRPVVGPNRHVPDVSFPMEAAAPATSLAASSSSQPVSVLSLSFNQDAVCFAAGTDHGFRVYYCDPFVESSRREFDRRTGGGIAVVAMLFRSKIYALVGGGTDPQFPPNKVMLWDDTLGRCVGELCFRSQVRSVKLRRDRVFIVLEHKLFVYNFADLKLLHQIETIANPKGLCAVSHVAGPMLLVCPGLQKGQIRLEHYAPKRTKFIMAHESKIAYFALTQDARLLATASTKGTLVRVFNTANGTLLQEVRRGADTADICSLAFSPTAKWLAVSSDKGTVHVFNLKINQVTEPSSPTTPLSFLKGVLPKYFSSEWSVAQFRLTEGCQYTVAFGHQKHTVIIIGLDGSFYRCRFDPVTGGEMTQLEYHNLLKPDAPI